MSPSGAVIAALLAAGPIDAGGAGPDAAKTRVRLEVRAAAACTSRDDLAARVTARSPRIQLVDDAAISAQVAVTSTGPGEVVADLVLAATGAEPSARRVVASSCAEAADAIALIIAVTLDPTQRRKAAAGAPPPRSAAPAEAADSRAPAEPAQPPPPAPPPPPATVRASEPPAPGPSVRTRRQLGASVAAQTVFGAAPAVMPGIALYAVAALDRSGAWAPALFLGAMHVWRQDLSEADGAASFTLDAATLDVCPLRLRWSRFEARPCAAALVGRMSARGSDTRNAATAARPFAVTGAAVAAGFGSTVVLSVRLAAGVTMVRDSYELAGNVFYRASLITTSVSLGVGARWP
jgi:hypothetical protein